MKTSLKIHERLLFTELAAIINGKSTSLILRGTIKEINAVKNVLSASKLLRETVEREDVTIDEITEKISKKNSAAKTFEHATGLRWPM